MDWEHVPAISVGAPEFELLRWLQASDTHISRAELGDVMRRIGQLPHIDVPLLLGIDMANTLPQIQRLHVQRYRQPCRTCVEVKTPNRRQRQGEHCEYA